MVGRQATTKIRNTKATARTKKKVRKRIQILKTTGPPEETQITPTATTTTTKTADRKGKA